MRLRILLYALLSVPLFAQEYRGAITGAVTDATGSGIAGAKVTVTETQTQTKVSVTTEGTGAYTASGLLPGDYEVHVTQPGFKDYIRRGIHLGAGERPVIDVKLEVGEVTQSVDVVEAAPLVTSENASIGQSITTKEVEDLPLNGGTPLTLANLSIGVVNTSQPGLIHPFDSGGAAGYSIGGVPAQTNEILINGSPDSTWDGRLAYSPPKDAVLEVRVKAFDTDAAYGHTGGGTLNQIIKSGTNHIHGTLFEFNQPNTLTANNFFNNRAGLGNPVTHYNQFGATVGGPVILPRVYNGRDKMFWFFAWESLKDSQPNTTFLTVPTAAERQGDFSALLALGPQYQLYNPFTAVQAPGSTVITRSPYVNNIIPREQLNPVARALLNYYPLPNIAPQRSDGYFNYGNTAPTTDDYRNFFGRIDYNVSDLNRIFFEARHTDYLQVKNNYFGNLSTGSLLTRTNWGSSLDDVITLNSANVVNLRLNFTRMGESHPSPSAGFDPTALGLPSYLAANSQYLQLPYITFASNTAVQSLGLNGANQLPSQSAQLYGNWTTIHGNHTIKAGADLRQYRLNVTSYGNSVGNFAFTANTWVRSASNASSTVVVGQDLASFLLGLPTGGSYDVNAAGSYYEYYAAGFVQDDWRVRKNLTLNLGLRFDHDSPYHEKYGRTLNGFDTTSPNPLNAAAMNAYNQNPVPQIPAGSFQVLGGPTYASSGNNQIYNTTSHLFSPRVGVAWSPGRFQGKTVLRAGFAMFVSPVTIASLSVAGTYSTNPILTQEGFSQSTALTPSTNNFLTPASTLSNPFPAGIQQPVGSSLGLGTYTGQTVGFLNPNMSNPYSLRWNFDVQQELAPNTMLEIAYMGNHAVHLPISATQLNSIPRQFLSTLAVRDQPLINSLTATVPNPFSGLITSGTPAGTTTSVAQLLSRFPQYPTGTASFSSGVIEQNLTIGSSYFEAISVRLQKRFSRGLTVIGNYMYSRLMERSSWLNDTDPVPEKRVSPFDHPHRFSTAISYELPTGRGRQVDFHSRALNAVLGGWVVNAVYTYQTGQPLVFANGSTTSPGDYVYLGGPLNVNNRNVDGTAFDVTRFDRVAADQFQYHIRTFPTTFSNIRQDGINQFDASMLKRFVFTENTRFELRGEFFNVINHPTFAAPNMQVTNSAFGTITAQSNRPRTIQLGARVVF
uniref:TonB-dependent transporter Oar-like beta-barrel domain-containing protein n=1 Tax=Solibacter usitatus (strain Ellin6076) TaxID=234267 RepID=Q01YX8_SOLUE